MGGIWFRGVAVLLLAAGLGCSTGSEDTCADISANICAALDECSLLTPPFNSDQQCVASFNGFWELRNSADEECRTEWEVMKDLTCDQLAEYLGL